MPPAAEPFGATTVGAPPVPTASAGPPGTERSGAAPDAVPVFCPLCGQRLPSGVAFCPGCGTPIS
ncbi:zinc-ribbon domain-containing protein [Ruthenibacterium lactatiformans]